MLTRNRAQRFEENSAKTIDAMSKRLGTFWHDGCCVEIDDGGFIFITVM